MSLFQPEKRIKAIWRRCPGALTATSLGEAKERLLTTAGSLWSSDAQTLSPLFTYYSRQNLMGGMSPPMAQEALTLGVGLDCILQGKIASAADVFSQRLKALEALSRGTHWSIARQHELVRTDSGGMAVDDEALAAAKLARAEEKLKGMVSRPPNAARGDSSQPYGQKGKKGKATGKGKQEDGGKGKPPDQKRDENPGQWQKKNK